MTTTLYGIPNCDTVKKARKWLDSQSITYTFVNFKKEPPSSDLLREWLTTVGTETLVNKRGTTWRKLPEAEQRQDTIVLLQQHTSIIKRPVLAHDDAVHIGFNENDYRQLFDT